MCAFNAASIDGRAGEFYSLELLLRSSRLCWSQRMLWPPLSIVCVFYAVFKIKARPCPLILEWPVLSPTYAVT